MKDSFKVVDLFAGPGGLGEGFAAFGYEQEKSPFQIAISIEKDASAHQTLFLRSFFRQFPIDKVPDQYWQYIRGEISKSELFAAYPKEHQAAQNEAKCIELGISSPREVKNLITKRLNGSKKWVLVGGPPCQAYSLVGRSRMQSTNPDFEQDERHFLYKEYLRIIADHRPPVFVMENVKGLLSAKHSGKKIIHSILSDLRRPDKAIQGRSSGLGYKLFSLVDSRPADKCDPEDFLVRAEQFGIPQARHRVLILGIREDIVIRPDIITPSASITVLQAIGDLPKIRSAVSKEEDSLEIWRDILASVQHEKWYQHGKTNGLLKVTHQIDTAIRDLRNRTLTIGGEVLSYCRKPKVHAQWYRHNCDSVISNHTGRSHMRSDLHRYLFASSFAATNDRTIQLGDFPKPLLPAHKNVLDGTDNDHFADRFRVQLKSRPSTTITSHISKDGHYFIHYDPSQCRSLTVREAARLQTFPDNYKFEGNKTSQYHQVGNAVPPLLSIQIAEIVHDILRRMRV